MMQRPDFVVVGGQHGDQVYLIASRSLRTAAIKTNYHVDDAYGMGGDHARTFATRCDIDLSVSMGEYIIVMGRDYQEAWYSLFRQWAPPPKPALPGQRALE